MDPLHILLVLLVIAGIWAVIELALTIRRARTTVDSLDKTMGEVNDMLAETRPVVAKLDGAIDELQPALTQVEPLLQSANVVPARGGGRAAAQVCERCGRRVDVEPYRG